MSNTDEIVTSIHEHVATITLNRPSKRNAITPEMKEAMAESLLSVRDRNDIKVTVIRGAGPCFSAGADITHRASIDYSDPRTYAIYQWSQFDWLEMIWDHPKPVIAQVHGYCIGSAVELAAVCDLTVCSTDATFSWPELVGGGVPGSVLPFLMGYKNFAEWTYTAGTLSAQAGEKLGMVNHVVPSGELEGKVKELTDRMSRLTASSLVFLKAALHDSIERMGIHPSVRQARTLSILSHMAKDNDSFWEIAKSKGPSEALKWRKEQTPQAET